MPTVNNDTIQINAGRDIDAKTGILSGITWVPHTSVATANTAINSAYRYKGLRVRITEGADWAWYVYKDGILDANLVREQGIIRMVSYTSNQTAAISDTGDTLVFLNTVSAQVIFSIAPASFTGRTFRITGKVPGANIARVTATSGTIVGQMGANYDIQNGECVTFLSDGTDLYIIAKN